jgi:hypothetical protein
MAMKMFEDRQRKVGELPTIPPPPLPSGTDEKHLTNPPHLSLAGKPVSHQFAKELIAGFAGGEVDRLAETKGADYIDREKAKHQAKRQAEQLYDSHYGGNDQYDPSQQGPPRDLQEHFGDNNW